MARKRPIKVTRQADDETFEFDAHSMATQLRDYFLRTMKQAHLRTPWNKLSESQQRDEIGRAEDRAFGLISHITGIIASGGYDVIHAKVDKYAVKNGEVTITAKGVADDEAVLTLNRVGPKEVKIIVADEGQFNQNYTPLAPDPDEPGLPGVKQELGPEDLGDAPEQPEEHVQDLEGETFTSGLEQAAPGGEPITGLRGKPGGPMEAYKGGVRWWSEDGKEWREATDADVLSDDTAQTPPEEDGGDER